MMPLHCVRCKIHSGLFQLKMLQIAESFIHLTFFLTVYYFHQSFESLTDSSYFHGHSKSRNRLDYGKKGYD